MLRFLLWLLLWFIFGCAAIETPLPSLPAECAPPPLGATYCDSTSEGWRACPAPDGSRWVFYPADYPYGAWDHFDAGYCRICHVWRDGTYVTRQMLEAQGVSACPSLEQAATMRAATSDAHARDQKGPVGESCQDNSVDGSVSRL